MPRAAASPTIRRGDARVASHCCFVQETASEFVNRGRLRSATQMLSETAAYVQANPETQTHHFFEPGFISRPRAKLQTVDN